MTMRSDNLRLGIISCVTAAYDASGRLLCNHSMGRLLDVMREMVPGARLCLPIVPELQEDMAHPVSFPTEDLVVLPPLKSVLRSQAHFFQTRRIVRRFARESDVLFIRLPFQIPTALLGLGTPKVMHVVGNSYNVIAASSDYRGMIKKLALGFASHSNNTIRRMAHEPKTRVATNGREMWDLLGCRAGRVVVSSCIYQREMRPRENLALGDPPRILFVGYLRPEKGIHTLLDAFDSIRRRRRVILTLVGGLDKPSTKLGAHLRERIAANPYHNDIQRLGIVDFGESLFDLYRSHDVFVLPSLSEGTPRTVVEARSFGCPVVATRVGGVPTSVTDGHDGLLIEPNDPEQLAAAIERILDDEPLRLRLIDNGLQGAHRHTLEAFAGELIEEVKLAASNGHAAAD